MPLIVFEGVDLCGKSTQIKRLSEYLTSTLPPDSWLMLREPGATRLGETLRGVLLDPDTNCCPESEMLLYLASRMQLVSSVIKPALAEKKLVILDRFYYSTIAYQIEGLLLDFMHFTKLEALVKASALSVVPDVVLYLDIDLETMEGRRRAKGKDRIEQRKHEYFERVLVSYRRQARSEPKIFHQIDGRPSEEIVWNNILAVLSGNSSFRSHLIEEGFS
jgi:dTMP kinase